MSPQTWWMLCGNSRTRFSFRQRIVRRRRRRFPPRFTRPFLRFRLLPWLMAVGYYQLAWLLYVCWPAASYRLNAAFEDHAEHEYMLFVTEHPDWEGQPYDGSFEDGYGHHGSLADLFRQIGHDERVHKLESLADLEEPRLGDARSAARPAGADVPRI